MTTKDMRFKRVKPSLKTEGGVGWKIGENRRKIRRKCGEKEKAGGSQLRAERS